MYETTQNGTIEARILNGSASNRNILLEAFADAGYISGG
jgi:hypothetical protein